MSEWYEDERFWEVLYPFLFGEGRFEEARGQVEPLVRLAGLREGGTVLDLCCGPGRFAVPLARRGFAVTGVDRSRFLLGKARAFAMEQGVEVEWVESDMRSFVRPGAFDAVLNLFTSFGYFEREEEDLEVLARVFESLRPGGRLVMDLSSKEWVARVFQPLHAEEVGDGSVLVERHRIADGWSRIENEWMLVHGDRVDRFSFSHRLYSGRELEDRLVRAGFGEVRLMGGLDAAPFDEKAQRLVVLARRPG
jgi:SAM-dependent methyltransferase